MNNCETKHNYPLFFFRGRTIFEEEQKSDRLEENPIDPQAVTKQLYH
ncbi:hypothetical protein JYQ62_17975 [Nostoc sp. UHCC 0702]|nr:hypothetical protein JYQ62_17975 [Nostoc sp. UHCC 0702]